MEGTYVSVCMHSLQKGPAAQSAQNLSLYLNFLIVNCDSYNCCRGQCNLLSICH